jgi:hypothetical protein
MRAVWSDAALGIRGFHGLTRDRRGGATGGNEAFTMMADSTAAIGPPARRPLAFA